MDVEKDALAVIHPKSMPPSECKRKEAKKRIALKQVISGERKARGRGGVRKDEKEMLPPLSIYAPLRIPSS